MFEMVVYDVDSTVNSSPFVISGEAFFLNSPSDFVRLSLSAQRAVKPNCIVDLRDDDDALKMQLEPDTPEPVPAEEPAAGVKVVVTEDQPAPSDRLDVVFILTAWFALQVCAFF